MIGICTKTSTRSVRDDLIEDVGKQQTPEVRADDLIEDIGKQQTHEVCEVCADD